MRLKEFIICLIIFTIIYFGFFILLDLFKDKRAEKKYINNVKKYININYYKKFARFYGIEGSISIDILLSIQKYFTTAIYPIRISQIANRYNISPYELVVCVLFFEYLNIFPKKCFSFEKDIICNLNMIDLNLSNKYNSYLIEKKPFDVIISTVGGNAFNDLVHLNQLFLIPGVRLINNKLYYVGDLNEEN